MRIFTKILSRKIIILLSLLVLLIPSISLARYYEKIENIKGNGTIAEPIFKVESLQNQIIQTVNKESNIEEYLFTIKNYEMDENTQNKRICEVNMEYTIKIANEKDNFPIEYKLYELNGNEDLLNGNKTTEYLRITANNEYEKTYRLVVSWKEKNDVLDCNDNIKIIVNASQTK